MTLFRRGLAALLVLLSATASAATAEDSVLAAWRLLDYVAVDYAEAVRDGQVINTEEYAEMEEFSAGIEARVAALPPSASLEALKRQAADLRASIAAKAPPADVARDASALAGALIAAYPAPVAPRAAPSMAAAAELYAANCAACHGPTGHGDGAAAAGMEPPPVDFHDAARHRQRSVFALYGVITHGVDGTGMRAYSELTEEQRWALAFHSGALIYGDEARARGAALWESDAAARKAVPDLQTLVQLTPATLAKKLGEADATAVMAHLRAHPEAAVPSGSDSLARARAIMAESVAAQAAGDAARARELALSAYLDGFEPIEPALAGVDRPLMQEVEAAMMEYRAALERGDPAAEVAAQAATVDALLARASERLDGPVASESAFAAGFVILFREGLEALLVLVALVAYLRKTGEARAMPYVHAGWIAALLAGIGTWAVATWLIEISGAQREIIEGATGLVAVAVLIVVGLWMHSQAAAGQWQAYIREQIQRHLNRNQLWGLALLSFVAVYREVFETVLFYRALWEQGAHASVLAGAGTAAVVLAAVAVALFKAGRKLPLQAFFRASAALIVVLAVVLAGRAMAALQEAGLFGVTQLPLPTIEWVGLFPTAQTVGGQLLVVAIVACGLWLGSRKRGAAPARN